MKTCLSITDLLEHHILILDGGMGTMAQNYGLGTGECPESLVLTRPETVARIHNEYLEAGADIITADTFNATRLSLQKYSLGGRVHEIAFKAACIARRAADEFTLRTPDRPRFAAGSIGPGSQSCSIAVDLSDLSVREVSFDTMVDSYREEITGLMDGGVDLLLYETCFDTLNCKAFGYAVRTVFSTLGRSIPVIISATLTDSGRLLGGQTLEAFVASVSHIRPLAFSLNCSFGAEALLPYVERLSYIVPGLYVCAYPNAGLPNLSGGYDESPEEFACHVEEYMRKGYVNIVGGCCGTTPDHIRLLAQKAVNYGPRVLSGSKKILTLSGLEPLEVIPEVNFVNVGERTNVAGSARFARMVREGRWSDAVSVARSQVEAGAQIIDVCMDDPMIDAPAAMSRFLRLMGAEPDIARVPVMIDSSRWDVLLSGLKVVQGKSIVNSISLRDGESRFRARAGEVLGFGAAAVVMLFDENGQADTFERKIQVASRAYELLVGDGFPAEDIIFDPNILAVGTGMAGHDRYALDFIDATAWIKKHLPGAKVSGGVSNLSFAFRGNNPLREAMHSAFLYHAIRAGMDMGIVNPQGLPIYDEIPSDLLEKVEDVILCRREDASKVLSEHAVQMVSSADRTSLPADTGTKPDVEQRLADAMLRGVTDSLQEDLKECLRSRDANDIIENVLMPAMEQVGCLFSSGKMFLPQVIKTARVMKESVDYLTPFMKRRKTADMGTVVTATVKGDVHDIGKNIAAVVMNCGGYHIEDMGVMVEAEDIARRAVETDAVCITLSGLITPSLEEMVNVCRTLERKGMSVPVIISGATASALHTAVRIAPVYSGPVIYSANANQNCGILSSLCGERREEYISQVRASQEKLRCLWRKKTEKNTLVPYEEALASRSMKRVSPLRCRRDVRMYRMSVSELLPLIDWNFYYSSWGLAPGNGSGHESVCRCPECDEAGRSKEAIRENLYRDALRYLDGFASSGVPEVIGIGGVLPAASDGENITVTSPSGEHMVFPMLRSQKRNGGYRSLCDFINGSDGSEDSIGCFIVSAGIGLKELTAASQSRYEAMSYKFLADRLAEAAAVKMQQILAPEGLRVAIGYSSCPDHSLKRELFGLLSVEERTPLSLTDHYMIDPAESVCGFIFPRGEYFDVGMVDDVQLDSYARRRNMSVEEIVKLLPDNTFSDERS